MNSPLLLVEDCIETACTIRVFLTRLGFDSDHVSSGQQALALLEERHDEYGAVLLDLHLDGLKGMEAVRRIRSHEQRRRLSRLPVIGLSAHDAADLAVPCIIAGMDAYLPNPFRFDLFQAVLESVLRAPMPLAA